MWHSPVEIALDRVSLTDDRAMESAEHDRTASTILRNILCSVCKFESSTSSDCLNRMVWPVRSCDT